MESYLLSLKTRGCLIYVHILFYLSLFLEHSFLSVPTSVCANAVYLSLFDAYDSFLIISERRIVVPMFLLSTSVKLVLVLSSVCAGLLAIGFSIIPN